MIQLWGQKSNAAAAALNVPEKRSPPPWRLSSCEIQNRGDFVTNADPPRPLSCPLLSPFLSLHYFILKCGTVFKKNIFKAFFILIRRFQLSEINQAMISIWGSIISIFLLPIQSMPAFTYLIIWFHYRSVWLLEVVTVVTLLLLVYLHYKKSWRSR